MTQVTHWPGDPMTQFHVWWALENGSADRQSMTVVRPLDRLIRFVEPTAVSNRRTDRQTTDLWLILLANVYVYCRHRHLHAIWQKSSISETQTNELSTSIRLEISPIMHLVLCRLLERNAPEPTSGDRKDADRSLLGYIGLSYTWQRSFTRSMFNEANEVTFERTKCCEIICHRSLCLSTSRSDNADAR